MPTPTQTVGRVAAELPQAMKVFARHGIDFWCGGHRTVESACRAKGIDPGLLLEEIGRLPPPIAEEDCWTDRPLEELTAHLISRYHDPHREELSTLEELAETVARVHGANGPARLGELLGAVQELREELEPHMMREERLFFPWIAHRESGVPQAVELMLDDHEDTAQLLERIRLLTGEYQLPQEACETWRLLWYSLEKFEALMRIHIHLENNVLFPRALAVNGAWYRG